MKSAEIKLQAFLANLPLFSDFKEQDLDRIAAGSSTLHAERGQVIVRRGDPCTGFHAVVYGQVKLGFTSAQGSEKVVDIIGPKQTFGEALMFLERPYIVSAQAIADSMLIHVSKNAVFHEIEADPVFARRLLAGLSRRLHGLVNDVEAYSLRSGAQRVIGYLLREESDEPTSANKLTVTLSTSKNIIASRLNLTPEHFSRILHELTSASLISVEGRNVHILDVERLRNYQ
ncbi:MAG: Crp/Fnr family transcriptional regulator [Betaproteobacteria bacterium]|nr:MAG: Crp/Fnr family transcriptional regulator [Betaproteobacteria bacterium]